MGQESPLFSIIIPTYDRPRQLTACLAALAQLDYPRNCFEVIVADDGSDAPLETVIAPFRNQLEVTLLRQPHAGPAAARNTGAARAKGRFLAFTDDDCAPAPDWLQNLAARFVTAADHVIIGGRTLNALPNNLYSTASQLIVDVGCAYLNTDPNHARFFTANNLALPADGFRALGGFDPTFVTAASEDRELCGRWVSRGYRMIYAPEVLVYHAHELTWRTFWRQHFNYGRGALLLQQARARYKWEHFRPDPRYYLTLLRYPFSQLCRQQAVLLSALLVVSQSASMVGLVSEWIRQRGEKNDCPVNV